MRATVARPCPRVHGPSVVDGLNGLAALLCLGAALLLSGGVEFAETGASVSRTPSAAAVVDATGQQLPSGPYERIVSAATIADQVLDAILEPERLIAVTGETRRTSESPWRHAGRATVEDLDDLESILALRPDLVVVANVAEARRVARLREAGLRVFDIGAASGVDALTDTIGQLGRLVGAAERADAMAKRFAQRMDAIAQPTGDRPAALYLGAWGSRLFGGAAGTSYHDVLEAAGLRDVAAAAGFEGWPAYALEELVTLDPEWIVTPASNAESLCRRQGLRALRACRDGQVVAIDDALIGDPGLGMLASAEAVHRAVFGD